jgi:hypothetical protein
MVPIVIYLCYRIYFKYARAIYAIAYISVFQGSNLRDSINRKGAVSFRLEAPKRRIFPEGLANASKLGWA